MAVGVESALLHVLHTRRRNAVRSSSLITGIPTDAVADMCRRRQSLEVVVMTRHLTGSEKAKLSPPLRE